MENTLLLENPLPFMTKSYFTNNILNDKYSGTKIEIALKNDIPNKILLHFKDSNTSEKFLSEYNNTFSITKTNETLEKIQENINKEIKEKLTPYVFERKYYDEYKTEYISSLNKDGLIYINEQEKQKIYDGIKYLISKFGKNLMQGKSVLNTSLPVFLFDKRTLHQIFAYEQTYLPYLISRAASCKEPIERLKYVTAFLISTLHLSTFQVKPFNPIIGETCQCKIGNFNLYLEHTVNHPITANFYGFDDEGKYEAFGYQTTEAILSPNSLLATRFGVYKIKFKDDNSVYTLRTPNAVLKGIAMGDRLYNYVEKTVVVNEEKNLCAYIEFNPDKLGFFKSFFKSKNTFPDHFEGQITDLSNVTIDKNGNNHELKKDANCLSKIEGGWTTGISFDGQEYWNIDDDLPLNMMYPEYLLPSDGSKRPDLICFIQNDQEKSQEEKEKLEVRQRQDRKLRSEYAQNKK